MDRVKCYLIGHFFWSCNTSKTFTGKIAESAFMSLHRYQARRQTTAKEFPIEEIIGSRQAGVGLRCRIVHRSELPFFPFTLYRTIQFYNFLEVLSILTLKK